MPISKKQGRRLRAEMERERRAEYKDISWIYWKQAPAENKLNPAKPSEENRTASSSQSVQDAAEERAIRERMARYRADAERAKRLDEERLIEARLNTERAAEAERQRIENDKQLAEERLELIRSGVLPHADASIMLESDESCHLEIPATSHKPNLLGRFIATNKRLIFLSSGGGFEMQWRRILRIEKGERSIYLESTASKGNGYYNVDEPVITEAVFTSLKLMSNGQLMSPQTAMHQHQITDIDNMQGLDFEHYVARVLIFKGYSAKVTKASGDLGVDIVAEKDGYKYAVQVKRYNQPINRRAISDAVAGKAPYGCHSAMVVTNNFFTTDAKKLAQATGCELVDRGKLIEWMVELQEYETGSQITSPSKEIAEPVKTQSEGLLREDDRALMQKPIDTMTASIKRDSAIPRRGITNLPLYLGGKFIEAGTCIWILSNDLNNYKIEYKNDLYTVEKSVITMLDT